ncbi:MAG TPA: response regulator [Pyrinomonadaceae bacterium]|nr:response regulator [Pyrinomonadaceae bacterium]
MPETVLDQSIAPATNTPPPTVPAKPTVLLAEDDAAVRRYLEVILRRAGYTVICAANGLEAIKAAMSSKVDVVVTDALMPHLNGHELCRYLRARPDLARIPVLLLSGLEPNAVAPSTSVHADAHLTKPVRPEDFTDCLANLLRARN